MVAQFDTAGVVYGVGDRGHDKDVGYKTWGNLDPFTQGYVEALFASRLLERDEDQPVSLGFSDLAPETLARIMEDCERFRRPRTSSKSAAVGALFWKNRAGNYLSGDGWMPLTPHLGEDGKVYLRDGQ